MGNTFEIESWLPKGQNGYSWFLQWTGEDKDEAFAELERLKATGNHPCLQFVWR